MLLLRWNTNDPIEVLTRLGGHQLGHSDIECPGFGRLAAINSVRRVKSLGRISVQFHIPPRIRVNVPMWCHRFLEAFLIHRPFSKPVYRA